MAEERARASVYFRLRDPRCRGISRVRSRAFESSCDAPQNGGVWQRPYSIAGVVSRRFFFSWISRRFGGLIGAVVEEPAVYLDRIALQTARPERPGPRDDDPPMRVSSRHHSGPA